jgi:hypothetical protein
MSAFISVRRIQKSGFLSVSRIKTSGFLSGCRIPTSAFLSVCRIQTYTFLSVRRVQTYTSFLLYRWMFVCYFASEMKMSVSFTAYGIKKFSSYGIQMSCSKISASWSCQFSVSKIPMYAYAKNFVQFFPIYARQVNVLSFISVKCRFHLLQVNFLKLKSCAWNITIDLFVTLSYILSLGSVKCPTVYTTTCGCQISYYFSWQSNILLFVTKNTYIQLFVAVR